MRRVSAGDYISLDGRYRVIRAWGQDYPRRRWTLFRVEENGDSDVLGDFGSLGDARAEIERLQQPDERGGP